MSEALAKKILKCAKELFDFTSSHISKAEYQIEEIEGLNPKFNIGEPMRNGMMASFRIELEDFENELSKGEVE